jgi:hypothetical protein
MFFEVSRVALTLRGSDEFPTLATKGTAPPVDTQSSQPDMFHVEH